MFFDTLSRRLTYVQLHYTHLIPFRHLLAQTFDTIPFEYSTFGWFANIICITYAAGRLPSSIQLTKKIIPDLCFQDTQKVTKKNQSAAAYKINELAASSSNDSKLDRLKPL